MTDRPTASTINDAQLDELYAERDGLSRMYLTAMGDLGIAINRLTRARDYARQEQAAGAAIWPDDLLAILNEPAPADRTTQLAHTLRQVLDRLKPLRDETGAPIGYVVHPVDPDEYQRWRDVLNQPKEQ